MEIEFKRFPALIVRRDTGAAAVMKRLHDQGPVRAGMVYFVSDAEFESLGRDVMALVGNDSFTQRAVN